jgi:hypothetical protein
MKRRSSRLRIACWTVGFLVVGAVLASCSSPSVTSTLCPGPVARVEVYNYFAGHIAADNALLDDPGIIAGLCNTVWSDLSLQPKRFESSELGQRSVTVLVMHPMDGAVKTVWVYRLVGHQADSALIFSDGSSYYLARQEIPPYYAPDADVIPRSQVPIP